MTETAAPALAPAPHGYVWSRWAVNPVEHISNGKFSQPICGAPLHPERLHIAERPSGLAPLCQRCQHRGLARARAERKSR